MNSIVPWTLHSILNDVERSIEHKLYYPAMLVSLTIPEICSALAMPKNNFVKQSHYIAFVDKYTDEPSLGCDGLTCYRLRGGVVHRASFAGHPYFPATHVLFSVPETRSAFHAFSIEVGEKNALCIDLIRFCFTMNAAARKWYSDHKDDRLVGENLKNVIRFCPSGLPPFISGMPIVASGD